MNDHAHIICLDAPAPPDYGGAIEMYYKIKALHGIGKKIILHYFKYNYRTVSGLEKYCKEIHSYKRKPLWEALFLSTPYIVRSRINTELVNRLNEDDYPVILEGFHCTGIIPYLKNKTRKIIVRVHNNEAAYYRGLASSETSYFKRVYFERESRLLEKYQHKLSTTLLLATLSAEDMHDLSINYGFSNMHFIPGFVPWDSISILEGKGNYCLYHGNLGVAENIKAVKFLIHVLSKTSIPLIISGKNPASTIQELVTKWDHISLIPNPGDAALASLIANAQINVLPSFNPTGVKFKLLNALFNGRFCITNRAGISGSLPAAGLIVANSAEEYISEIKRCMELSFTEEMVQERFHIQELYNNRKSAQMLNALLL